MINLTTFFTSLGITGGNTQATNFYDFWKGIIMNGDTEINNITEFMTYLGTTRYEFFHSLESTYPNVFNEYTFYQNIDDPRIYDFSTFYTYGGEYLGGTPVTPTPTPTNTPTPTPSPTPTPTPSPSPTAVSIGYRTSFEDPANASAYTFNSLSTGGAGLIAISFGWEGASGVVSNVTIGGTTATLAYQDNQPGPGVATYYAFTTASTVNVSITFTAQQLRIIGGMWRITGYVSSTPTATAIGLDSGVATSASTITITGITNNSVVIALQSNGTQSTPVTWTGATERFDLDTDSNLRASGADASGTSTSLTISTTYPTSTQRTKLLGVAWR